MIGKNQLTQETRSTLKSLGYRLKKSRTPPKYKKQIALSGSYDMLEYFGLVRKYFQARYKVSYEDLECFFYLYPKCYFTKSDFNNYPMSWGSKRFDNYIKKGFISKLTPNIKKGAIYYLAPKAKSIVRSFHMTLAGERNIPQQPFFNPLLSKNANAFQKLTHNIMKEMRESLQKTDGTFQD